MGQLGPFFPTFATTALNSGVVDVGTCVVHDHVDALFVNPTAELLSFGGVATINGDFSEVLGDTSGLFDDARSDGSGIGSAGRNTHAGDERWRDGSERYFVGVAAPDHRTNGRGEMHIKAHYDAGRLVVGGAFVCGSSVGVFAASQSSTWGQWMM